MAVTTDIGTLLVRDDNVRHGRPRIAGTGITVHRVVGWYKLGMSPEDIVRDYPHLSLAQVHAALAHYHANQQQIETELDHEQREEESIERQARGGAA